MRVPRIHQDIELRSGARIPLDETASRHLLRVLRLKAGARLTVFDGRGRECEATLEAGGAVAVVRLGTVLARQAESPLRIVLAQGISRGERMDYTLQKAVELGVARLLPLFTRRCQVKLSGIRLARRLEHWRGVIRHACEQCGRNVLPELDPPRPLADAPWDLGGEMPGASTGQPEDVMQLLLDADGDTGLGSLPRPAGPIVLVAGPEGGLDPQERRLLQDRGFRSLRLGPRILRTETAAVAALAALQARWGDLG